MSIHADINQYLFKRVIRYCRIGIKNYKISEEQEEEGPTNQLTVNTVSSKKRTKLVRFVHSF